MEYVDKTWAHQNNEIFHCKLLTQKQNDAFKWLTEQAQLLLRNHNVHIMSQKSVHLSFNHMMVIFY